MPILHSYYQDVYRCPIVRLDGYSAQHGLSTGILAYLDFGGATGSSKDGLAETMLAFATERGTLQPGMPVVEASSGSFGAALAVSCATTGHPCILVVPSNLPIAQRKRLQDLGAHIIACSSSGRRAMERVAEDTAKRYGGYYTHYFSNDDNPEYHRRVTGPQIYKNAGDAIDAIVIGVGSGGTITGVAEGATRTVIGGVLRFLAHYIIGAVVWGKYMPDEFFGMTMTSPWIYSALYNGSFLLLSLAMVLVVIAILQKPLGKYLRGDDLKK